MLPSQWCRPRDVPTDPQHLQDVLAALDLILADDKRAALEQPYTPTRVLAATRHTIDMFTPGDGCDSH
jgi:hypothetical protein